ncbi:MAG TPA: two-component system response regulator KdpE [Steroidobacteraceae bacterium]
MAEPLPVAILVEDERQIRRFVRTALEAEGWNVHETDTLRQGLTDAATRRPDLIILDLGLPDGDGVDFLHDLRGWSKVPVIVLSARVDERDKIDALDAGADDYLTKPFGVGELLARVRATSRRRTEAGAGTGTGAGAGATFAFGDVKIDLSLRTVHKGGAAIHLTPIEYRLLSLLIANAGKVLTHRQILREVWGPAHSEDGHYVRVYMGHLRQKLENDPAQPRHILTETAVGYRLVQGER